MNYGSRIDCHELNEGSPQLVLMGDRLAAGLRTLTPLT